MIDLHDQNEVDYLALRREIITDTEQLRLQAYFDSAGQPQATIG